MSPFFTERPVRGFSPIFCVRIDLALLAAETGKKKTLNLKP